MVKKFQTVEDVVADESFLNWYYKESEERIHEWESWLSVNPDQAPLVQEAIEFMDQLSLKKMPVSAEETERQLTAIHKRIDENNTPVVRMRSSRKRWWISAAAAVVLIAASVTYFTWGTSSCPSIDTVFGEVRSNALPDGSTMILNANSNATLSTDWEEGKDREVWLNGEAFFKVAKTPQKSRFIVHAGELDVIVTGTQFNVLNRDGKTTVLLTEGSVILRTKDGKEMAMKPGDYVEMDHQLVEKKLVKEENVLAWKDNRLAFDNTPLKEAAQMISYHYGVKITLEDNLGNATLTGIMTNNNLDELLKAIEFALDVRVTRANTGEIIFSAK